MERHDAWTLYVKEGENVELEPFRAALAPAFDVVERELGPFRSPVRVHAWTGTAQLENSRTSELTAGDGMADVPGIGPARVRAFHVRGGGSPFGASGVFLGTPEVGTAVHELVHARLAEIGEKVPLWFEEGLASMWGDGAFHEGRWVVDGYSCWPTRVLRDEQLSDKELARLLGLSAQDSYSARENLLMHFVGWAIVFDLYREDPGGAWRGWLATFRGAAARGTEVGEARRRLQRSVSEETERAWLTRLDADGAAVRLAAAKATWKLHSPSAMQALLAALEDEQDPEVRYGIALNAMLAINEISYGRNTWRRFSRLVFPVLREPSLDDPGEQLAAEEFYSSLRSRRRSTQSALDLLARYWEE
jgi:hypothetical protein